MRAACIIPGGESWAACAAACCEAVEREDMPTEACDILVFSNSDTVVDGLKNHTCRQYISEAFSAGSICAEAMLPIVKDAVDGQYDLLVFAATPLGNELAVRLAAQLHASCITNAEQIRIQNNALYVTKGAYSQNLKAEYRLGTKPYCVGLSAVCKAKAELAAGGKVHSILADAVKPSWMQDVVIEQLDQDSWEQDVKLLLIGGRGIGSKQGMDKLALLAKRLGGEIAGTRPAVMDGWLPIDRVVGMSGKVVAPEICITFGVAGSMAFMLGVEKCGTLISVNNDSTASIFKLSDAGICEDWQEIADIMLDAINGRE